MRNGALRMNLILPAILAVGVIPSASADGLDVISLEKLPGFLGEATEAIEYLCQALRLGYALAQQNLTLALARDGEREDVVKRCREPQRDLPPRPAASVTH